MFIKLFDYAYESIKIPMPNSILFKCRQVGIKILPNKFLGISYFKLPATNASMIIMLLLCRSS